MRTTCILSFLLCFAAVDVPAQQSDTGQPTLTVRSTLVQVPALVKTKGGQVIFGLTAADFLLTDDGVPQDLTLDQDTDSQPLALATVVETGGAGARHLIDYRQLDAILDALVGGVEHRVAVIAFDSTPHLLRPFAPDTAGASLQLASLREGDPGGAILDAVAFAVEQLRVQPTRYRRAILLLSETVDQGSKTTLSEALRLISDTNTTMYSFGFSSNLPNAPSNFMLQKHDKGLGGAMPHTEEEAIRKLHESGTVVMPLLLKDLLYLQGDRILARDKADFVREHQGSKDYPAGDANKYAELTGGFAVGLRGKGVGQRLSEVIDSLWSRYTVGYRPAEGKPPGTFCRVKVALAAGRSAAFSGMDGAGASWLLPEVARLARPPINRVRRWFLKLPDQ
jgi:VWFA-related protein